MTITAEFDAGAERVWELWSDPRQLERWWGPPNLPGDLRRPRLLTRSASPTYFMTGPEGEKYHGWWRIEEVEPPNRLRFEDGFADDEGKPNHGVPDGDGR